MKPTSRQLNTDQLIIDTIKEITHSNVLFSASYAPNMNHIAMHYNKNSDPLQSYLRFIHIDSTGFKYSVVDYFHNAGWGKREQSTGNLLSGFFSLETHDFLGIICSGTTYSFLIQNNTTFEISLIDEHQNTSSIYAPAEKYSLSGKYHGQFNSNDGSIYDEFILTPENQNTTYKIVQFGFDENLSTYVIKNTITPLNTFSIPSNSSNYFSDKTLIDFYYDGNDGKFVDGLNNIDYLMPTGTDFTYSYSGWCNNNVILLINNQGYYTPFYFEGNQLLKEPTNITNKIPCDLTLDECNGFYSVNIGLEKLTIYKKNSKTVFFRTLISTGEILERIETTPGYGLFFPYMTEIGKILKLNENFEIIGIDDVSNISSTADFLLIKNPMVYKNELPVGSSKNNKLIPNVGIVKSIAGSKGYGGVVQVVNGEIYIPEGNIFELSRGYFGSLEGIYSFDDEIIDGQIITLVSYVSGQCVIRHDWNNIYLKSGKDLSLNFQNPNEWVYSITLKYDHTNSYWYEISGNSIQQDINFLKNEAKDIETLDVSMKLPATNIFQLKKINTNYYNYYGGVSTVSIDNCDTFIPIIGLESFDDICYFNNKYIATQNNGFIWESVDGITFVRSPILETTLNSSGRYIQALADCESIDGIIYFVVTTTETSSTYDYDYKIISISSQNTGAILNTIVLTELTTFHILSNILFYQTYTTDNFYVLKSIDGSIIINTPVNKSSYGLNCYSFGNKLMIIGRDQSSGVYFLEDYTQSINWKLLPFTAYYNSNDKHILGFLDSNSGQGRIITDYPFDTDYYVKYPKLMSYVTNDGGSTWKLSDLIIPEGMFVNFSGSQDSMNFGGLVLNEKQDIIWFYDGDNSEQARIINKTPNVAGVYQNKYVINCISGINTNIATGLPFSNDSMIQFKKVSDNSNYVPTSYTYSNSSLSIETIEAIELNCIFIGPKK